MTFQPGQHGKTCSCSARVIIFTTCHGFWVPGGEWWDLVGVVRYDKTNEIFQYGQHDKTTAQILHCPSEFCKFQRVMGFGCLGVMGSCSV